MVAYDTSGNGLEWHKSHVLKQLLDTIEIMMPTHPGSLLTLGFFATEQFGHF